MGAHNQSFYTTLCSVLQFISPSVFWDMLLQNTDWVLAEKKLIKFSHAEKKTSF